MNKIFKVASVAIIALVANTAFAQTDDTTLKVNVAAVYSIVVTDPEVTIDMDEADHFVNGNASDEQAGHIEVTATDAYTVTVSSAATLVGEAEAEEISAGTVVVTAVDGTYLGNGADAGSTADFSEAQLGDTDGTLLITGSGGDLRSFNVTYTIPAASAQAYINVPVDTYTTVVTYTIAAE
jgi:hypothetical protein